MKVLKRIFLGLFLSSAFSSAYSQTNVFAQLQGQPNMVTTGWNLTGSAVVGDTPGDTDTDPNELVLTPAVGNNSGGVFFAQPLNLTLCQKWKAEFEFRMFDGGGADGIAFCFLDVPPSGFVSGGGVGIPATANGLKVVFDTYNNQTDIAANPQIQIRYGVGYNQFLPPFNSQPSTAAGQTFLRSNTYQPARIEYDNGNISVYVNNTLYLTGTYNINFTGYVGFTSSTGGVEDRHSIRNVTIYADVAPSNAGPDVSYCTGSSVQIGTTPDPNLTYSWSPAVGLSATNVANPTVNLTNLGSSPITFTYTVTSTIVGSNTSCSSQDQVTVTINPIPTSNFTISKSTACENEPVTVTYTGNMGATAAYTWNFNGGTVISGTGQGPYQVSWPTDGPKQVTLAVSVSGCNSNTTTKNITINPIPEINITGPASICLGDTAIFTGTSDVPGAVFTWNPGAITGNPIKVSPSTITAYTVSAVSPNGCVSEDTTFTLVVKLVPVANITGDTIICKGDSTQLFGTSNMPGSQFFWAPDGDTTTQIWVSPPVNTTYGLAVNKDGCRDTAYLSVRVDSVPNLQVPDSLQICIGEQINVTVNSTTPNTLFNWQPGNLSGNQNTLSPTVDTEYSVYAYNETCTSETKVFEIKVLQNCDCKLIIPDVITPNGDQLNDVFTVLNPQACDIASFDFVLYNRWGTAVWKSDDIQKGWEGKCLMGDCSDGTYFWVFRYSYIPGGTEQAKTITEKGMLTVFSK